MSTAASATTQVRTPASAASVLRPLYLARFGFATLWAGLFALTSSPFGSAALVLAMIYPVVDIAAALVDARWAPASGRSAVALRLNLVVSAIAAVALAVVGTGDVGDVLVVWGAWAIAAGAVQLVVALQRRGQRGQRPMILSGGLSVVAGIVFAASSTNATSVGPIAGYAVVGGLFFLVSALRLGRPDRPVV